MADLQIDVRGNAVVTLREIATEGAKADKSTQELKESVTALGSAMAQVKARAVDALIDSLKEFALTIPQGTAHAARHEQALRALGPAYALVQQQTRGTVTAEQAWQVQQRLTQSGLRVSAQELANITMRAREYARATGTETTQALEQLTDALRQGGGEEIRKFGITVQTGITRTEGFQSALRQLDVQARATTPSQVTVAESQERLNRALDESKTKLQAFIAEKTDLQDFFEQFTSWLEDATKNSDSLGQSLARVARGIASETTAGGNLERGALDVAIGSTAAGFVRRLGGQQGAENEADVLTSIIGESFLGGGFGISASLARPQGQSGTPGTSRDPTRLRGAAALQAAQQRAQREARQRAEAAQAAARTRAADEARALEEERRRQAALDRAAQLAPVDPNQLRAARLGLNAARIDALAAGQGDALGIDRAVATPTDQRDRRLAALRTAATSTGAQRGENEVARLNRLAAATREYVATLRQYRDEDERVAEQLRVSAEAEGTRRRELEESNRTLVDTMRRERTERLGMLDEERQVNRARDAAENPGGRGDARRQQDRLRELGELRGAFQELLAQTDARLQQAQAEGRDQGEINTLMQERLGLLRSLSGATQELTAIQREQNAATIAFKDSMVSALSGVADGFGAAAVAALDGEKSFGDAMAGMLREQAKALAKQAIIETLKNTALGFYNLGIGNVPGALSNFKAAGLWAAVGLAAGVTVAATSSPATGAAGGASQGSTRSAGVERAARPEQGGGPLVLNINVSGAVFTGDEITEVVSRGVRRGVATGRLPTRILRED